MFLFPFGLPGRGLPPTLAPAFLSHPSSLPPSSSFLIILTVFVFKAHSSVTIIHSNCCQPLPSPISKTKTLHPVNTPVEYVCAQSCLTLCNPVHCSLPGSSFHGILQARVLEWGAIAFSVEVWRKQQQQKLLNKPESKSPTNMN